VVKNPILRPWPERPIGVALVITDLDVGGAERALTALATRLDRSRWRVGVFCLSGPGALVEVIRGAGLPCECLDVGRRNPVRAVARLAASLRRFGPELIQSFLFHANLAARLAAPWVSRPRPPVLGGIRVAERQRRWHLQLDRWTSRLVAGEVCVSRGVLAFSRDVGGLDPSRLTVIPNGIDPAPIDAADPVPRANIGIPDEAHLALFVGRLDPQKGLPDLLDAAERVIARRPDWHLALAGDGPERDWLLGALAARPALRDRVRWLGRRDDVPGLLKAADVLVQASHWEGMPNAVLEAMAARRAVVGTAVEGTEDLVVPGETGWLVPPRDPAALAHALEEAAEDPDRCRRYGQAGRLRVEREFTLDAVVAAYERLWAGVLGLRL
jgi:starch synthase (maltosyl-transferring)